MLLTEDEYRAKWCPSARVLGPRGHAFSRGYGGSIAAGTNCVASRCAHWRWGKPQPTRSIACHTDECQRWATEHPMPSSPDDGQLPIEATCAAWVAYGQATAEWLETAGSFAAALPVEGRPPGHALWVWVTGVDKEGKRPFCQWLRPRAARGYCGSAGELPGDP